jgi:hypothetical protein
MRYVKLRLSHSQLVSEAPNFGREMFFLVGVCVRPHPSACSTPFRLTLVILLGLQLFQLSSYTITLHLRARALTDLEE